MLRPSCGCLDLFLAFLDSLDLPEFIDQSSALFPSTVWKLQILKDKLRNYIAPELVNHVLHLEAFILVQDGGGLHSF